MSTPAPTASPQGAAPESDLARFAQRNGSGPKVVAATFRDGFWDLTTFLQLLFHLPVMLLLLWLLGMTFDFVPPVQP